jgi:hypothetical protein
VGKRTFASRGPTRSAQSPSISLESRKPCIEGPGFVCRACVAPPQFGVLSSPASQPVAFDLIGSNAMTLISTWSHLGHSNNRCSKPIGPVETRSSIIRVWQREQRGRSIAVRNCWDEDTMLPCFGREHYRLSVTDVCRWRGGDGTSMRFRVPAAMVKIAHFPEFNRPSDRLGVGF